MEYFQIHRPSEPALPIVVDVPHAGEWIPDVVRSEMVVGDQVLRRDLDLYVDRLWQHAPAHGATLIVSNVSRYVVDLNRAEDDISPDTVSGGLRLDRPGYYHDRGVVWRTTTDGTAVMGQAMTSSAFQRRLDTFYRPYHAALHREIARLQSRFGYCILLDGHSMPSLGRSGHLDSGVRRADIVPGDVDGQACHRMLTTTVIEHFRDQGYTVRTNDPYKGGWITRYFGQPENAVHAIQIEVNRALYMDEVTFKIRAEGIKRLINVCTDLLPRVGTLKLHPDALRQMS